MSGTVIPNAFALDQVSTGFKWLSDLRSELKGVAFGRILSISESPSIGAGDSSSPLT